MKMYILTFDLENKKLKFKEEKIKHISKVINELAYCTGKGDYFLETYVSDFIFIKYTSLKELTKMEILKVMKDILVNRKHLLSWHKKGIKSFCEMMEVLKKSVDNCNKQKDDFLSKGK